MKKAKRIGSVQAGESSISLGMARVLVNEMMSMMKQAQDNLKRRESRILRLEETSSRDEQTGLYNRRGFQLALDAEMSRVERASSRGGIVILIEIENFTTILKSHGARAGQQVLNHVARHIEKQVRAMDIAARLSYEEFALLFPDTGRDSALGRIQKLALDLNKLTLGYCGEDIAIHTSLSVKHFTYHSNVRDILRHPDRQNDMPVAAQSTAGIRRVKSGKENATPDTEHILEEGLSLSM